MLFAMHKDDAKLWMFKEKSSYSLKNRFYQFWNAATVCVLWLKEALLRMVIFIMHMVISIYYIFITEKKYFQNVIYNTEKYLVKIKANLFMECLLES